MPLFNDVWVWSRRLAGCEGKKLNCGNKSVNCSLEWMNPSLIKQYIVGRVSNLWPQSAKVGPNLFIYLVQCHRVWGRFFFLCTFTAVRAFTRETTYLVSLEAPVISVKAPFPVQCRSFTAVSCKNNLLFRGFLKGWADLKRQQLLGFAFKRLRSSHEWDIQLTMSVSLVICLQCQNKQQKNNNNTSTASHLWVLEN